MISNEKLNNLSVILANTNILHNDNLCYAMLRYATLRYVVQRPTQLYINRYLYNLSRLITCIPIELCYLVFLLIISIIIE